MPFNVCSREKSTEPIYIPRADIHSVLSSGEVVAKYPDDTPFPSVLMLGFINKRPLHVVVVIGHDNACYVVTTYIPSIDKWSADYKIRR